MLRTLKAMARHRGEERHQIALPHRTNHDLRGVVRSGLSALRLSRYVCEAILAHRSSGIVGTYDVHEYQDEKREALEAWARRIKSVVEPKPDKRHPAAGTRMSPIGFSVVEWLRLRARQSPAQRRFP